MSETIIKPKRSMEVPAESFRKLKAFTKKKGWPVASTEIGIDIMVLQAVIARGSGAQKTVDRIVAFFEIEK